MGIANSKIYREGPHSIELESSRSGGSSWPQVNPACPLTLPHNHYTQSNCFVGILGWKHNQNRPNGHKLPMKWSLPDVFLTNLMESDPPTILSCSFHIVRMIFAFYSVSFWPSWPEICRRKSSSILAKFIRGQSSGKFCTLWRFLFKCEPGA